MNEDNAKSASPLGSQAEDSPGATWPRTCAWGVTSVRAQQVFCITTISALELCVDHKPMPRGRATAVRGSSRVGARKRDDPPKRHMAATRASGTTFQKAIICLHVRKCIGAPVGAPVSETLRESACSYSTCKGRMGVPTSMNVVQRLFPDTRVYSRQGLCSISGIARALRHSGIALLHFAPA